jgi:hypothetical protein
MGITVATKTRRNRAYPYFYCLGRQVDKTSCPQGYVSISAIEDAVHAYWSRVQVSPERLQTLRRSILDSFAGKHEQGKTEIEHQRRRIIQFEQRRKKAKAAYYADVLELAEFKAEQQTIRQGIKAAEAIIARWSVELESITQALDDALRLMEDPQGFYDAVPEGLKVLLMQTVFQKLWVLDTAVVGCELTDAFVDLLTLEARVALGGDGEATYYRRREAIRSLSHLGDSWKRPTVERPYGLLAIDQQNPGLIEGRSSKIEPLAGVMGFKLNPELAKYFADDQAA